MHNPHQQERSESFRWSCLSFSLPPKKTVALSVQNVSVSLHGTHCICCPHSQHSKLAFPCQIIPLVFSFPHVHFLFFLLLLIIALKDAPKTIKKNTVNVPGTAYLTLCLALLSLTVLLSKNNGAVVLRTSEEEVGYRNARNDRTRIVRANLLRWTKRTGDRYATNSLSDWRSL